MRYRSLLGVACGLLIWSSSAHAQRAISLAVTGGASLPIGAYAKGADPGWHAGAGLVLHSPWQPISLRADATYHRFDFNDENVPGNQETTSGTLSLAYRLPSAGASIAPYITAGAGAYHMACGGDASCQSSTSFGWSAGAGMRTVILGLNTFLEARYHDVVRDGANPRFVPISIGIIL
jgi:hypothetical protein